jgi:4-hydroxy-tetrahydrodipicolinate reductase
MSQRVRVIQFGLGPIGQALAAETLAREDMELVGGVDRAPELAGRHLEELLGPQAHGLPRIVPNLGDLSMPQPPRVVLHATGSRLPSVLPELEEILSSGCHCVSSCEELSYPYLHHPGLAKRLDALAREHRVGLVGAGVNPGFILDLLPAVLSAACRRVDKVRASRIVDVTRRREPLRRKVGMGLGLDAYRTKEAALGNMGHVGLGESAALLASALGWESGTVTESCEPVVAEREVRAGDMVIPPGSVLGTRTRASLRTEGTERIALQVTIAAGVEMEEDRVQLDGDPPLTLVIPGGIPGDSATASILVSVARRIAAVPPGLHTMLTLPVVPPGRRREGAR